MVILLTEERHAIIIEKVRQDKSVKLPELCEMLGASESTVRRDLSTLDERGLIKKVHGGAISVDERSWNLVEKNVEEKSKLFNEEKTAIARYAASLIDDGDFVYIDAGTTTEKMIDFLPEKNITFVTNGFTHAQKLAQRGFKTFIPAGEIKGTTEAIIGAECVSSLQSYNFTKSFIGANGISLSNGITTPDRNEACCKRTAVQNSLTAYILADHSKFNQTASATFAQFGRVKIITDKLTDKEYMSKANIKEVM
ncbi:MAG: DeoR/GlpR family DNA-binding transcription regulator [Clostridiales bacterium]|nr:DeoR/GlpR family DNA-binding transcription regulator [Clostridiales bacterium]